MALEKNPIPADEDLEARMEIRRIERVGVAGEVARGNVQRTADRDAEVRKVAAHAGALSHRLGRGSEGR